jgi:hypothetical protein
MNWGYKILLLFSGFVIMILFMVFLAYRQDVPLVAEDYYRMELNYQEEINMLKNARSLDDPVIVEFTPEQNIMVIRYPESQSGPFTGRIRLMRPSDPALDTEFSVKTGENHVQEIRIGSLRKGFWKLKIFWMHGSEQFLEDKDIIIQ